MSYNPVGAGSASPLSCLGWVRDPVPVLPADPQPCPGGRQLFPALPAGPRAEGGGRTADPFMTGVGKPAVKAQREDLGPAGPVVSMQGPSSACRKRPWTMQVPGCGRGRETVWPLPCEFHVSPNSNLLTFPPAAGQGWKPSSAPRGNKQRHGVGARIAERVLLTVHQDFSSSWF